MSIAARMARMLKQTAPEQFTAPTLSRYLSDPAYRAELDAERAEKQRAIGAEFDARDRARQEKLWAQEDGAMLGGVVL